MRISDWSSDVCSSDLRAERLDPLGEAVRYAGRGDVAPEGSVVAARERIMRDHEVADRLILMERVAVEARHDFRIYRGARQQRGQKDDRRLDQMNRRRFDRVEQPATGHDRATITSTKRRKNVVYGEV